MTKMHMEWAARLVKNSNADEAMLLAASFAAMFSYFNPRFDRSRFMVACGLPADY